MRSCGDSTPIRKTLNPACLRLVEQPAMPGHINPGLDNKGLLDLVLDDQIAKLFAPLGVREEIVIAEEHDIGRNRLEFFDDRFDWSFGVASLLAKRVETERAELAFERASPRCQYRVERVAG